MCQIIQILKKFALVTSSTRKRLLAATYAILLLVILHGWGFGIKMDMFFQDITKRIAARFWASSAKLVILAIDNETLEEVDQRWPWSRKKFAELVKQLTAHQPEIILFDIVFQQPDEESDDAEFERAIRTAKNVALVSFIDEVRTASGKQLKQYKSLKRFRDAAYCDGYIKTILSVDGKTRMFSLADESSDEISCLVKLALKQKYIKNHSELPECGHIILARKGSGIQFVSASDLFNNVAKTGWLKDKIVIVGTTASVLHDFHDTSYGMISGPEVLAASLDTVINDRVASSTDGFMARAVLVLAGLLLFMLLSSRACLKHELVDAMIFVVLVPSTYLISTFFQIFLPWSCMFLAWALTSISYSLMAKFVETIDRQIAKAEAELAGKIQKKLFPRQHLNSNDYLIRGFCNPCSATGGDYYDYFQFDDNNLIFMVGDVSGHGFSAAIITVIAKTIVHLHMKQAEFAPEKIVSTLNDIILELAEKKKFLTLAIGHVNISTHQLKLLLAGHTPPIKVSREGKLTEYIKSGFPIGMVKKLPINEITCEFQPGDSLLIYTDGIPEALDWKEKQYTYDAWYDYLRRTLPTFTEQNEMITLLADVDSHRSGRDFDDDVTYILVQRSVKPTT